MKTLANVGNTFVTVMPRVTLRTDNAFDFGVAPTYCIRGRGCKNPLPDGSIAFPTTDANTGESFVTLQPGEGSVFVFMMDAAGEVYGAQGSVESLTTEDDGLYAKFTNYPQFPRIRDDLCPFLYVMVKVGAAGSAWTFPTSGIYDGELEPLPNIIIVGQQILAMPDHVAFDLYDLYQTYGLISPSE